jgi:hypothetical protein
MALEPITKVTSTSLQNADPETLKVASDVCFVAGFASIAGSIAAWAMKKGDDTDAKAERLGIFIGLWAPTFFILSNRFERYAERSREEKSL